MVDFVVVQYTLCCIILASSSLLIGLPPLSDPVLIIGVLYTVLILGTLSYALGS